jgi:hypothetical protein
MKFFKSDDIRRRPILVSPTTSSRNLSPSMLHKYDDNWFMGTLNRKDIQSGHLLPVIIFDGIEGMREFVNSIENKSIYPYFKTNI